MVDSTIVFNLIVDSAFLFYALTIIDIDRTIVLLGAFNNALNSIVTFCLR